MHIRASHFIKILAVPGAMLFVASGCSMQDMAGSNPLSGFGGMGKPYIESSREEIARKKSSQLQAALDVYNREEVSDVRDYFTGPNDILEISIQALKQPDELSTFRRTVSKEGTVILPLIDQMHVAGRNTRTIENLIAKAYDNDFLKDPQVTVSMHEYRSAPVVVNGAVGSPGIVYLKHNRSSVLEILSMVSGLDANAGDELIIVRDTRTDSVPGATDPTGGTPLIGAALQQPETLTGKPESPAATDESPGKPKKQSFMGRLFGGKDEVDTDIPEAPPEPAEVADPNDDVKEEETPQSFLSRLFGDADETPEASDENADAGDADAEESHAAPTEVQMTTEKQLDQKKEKQTIVVDLDRLFKRGDIRLNLAIYGGDTITVPPQKILYVYVIGYVRRPGQVKIPLGSDSVRAIHAIAMAGGLDSTARAQKCKLMREGHGTVKVDLTKVVNGSRPPVYLEPGDQFIVGATWMAKMLEFVKIGVTGGATVSPTP